MAGRKRTFLIALIFGVIFSGMAQGQSRVSLAAKADKNRVAVGEEIVLTVSLQWIQAKDEKIRIVKIKPPENSLLELVNSSQVSKSEIDGGKVVSEQVFKFIFKAKAEGVEEISPLTAEYIAGDTRQKVVISSEPIEVKVISLKEKFISGLRFMAVPAAGVFAGIMGLFLLLKKRRKKRNSAGSNKGPDAYYEREAMDKLIDITKYRLIGNFRKYYTQLHCILADYIRAKYHIQIKNKTEAEIRQLFSEVDIPGELLKLVIDTARLSETVKFAGAEVNPNEERKVFTGIERYLRSLIPKEREEKIELIKEVE